MKGMKREDILLREILSYIWDALRDVRHLLILKNVKKHPWRIATFRKVAGFTKNFIPKATLLHWCFWCFLNCTNGTKSQKSYHRFNIFNSGNTTSRLVTLKVKQNVLGTVLTNWSICDCKLNVCIWLKKTSNINKSHMYIDL